jgi:hypothetical protein
MVLIGDIGSFYHVFENYLLFMNVQLLRWDGLGQAVAIKRGRI